MSSQIAAIVDYSAWRAAVYVPGIAAIRAPGTSGLIDPLTGEAILPPADAPTVPFEHWSELPIGTVIDYNTQDGRMAYTWEIPMRLWLARADIRNLRSVAIPFYAAYLSAFMTDPNIGGLAVNARLSRFEVGVDDKWGWLDITLEVQEMVTE
jgi:hypothetical protein